MIKVNNAVGQNGSWVSVSAETDQCWRFDDDDLVVLEEAEGTAARAAGAKKTVLAVQTPLPKRELRDLERVVLDIKPVDDYSSREPKVKTGRGLRMTMGLSDKDLAYCAFGLFSFTVITYILGYLLTGQSR